MSTGREISRSCLHGHSALCRASSRQSRSNGPERAAALILNRVLPIDACHARSLFSGLRGRMYKPVGPVERRSSIPRSGGRVGRRASLAGCRSVGVKACPARGRRA